tara:strand:- start:241 stop:405 length:165 start_codon:yes stop_codon:yes gene_type:complete
MGHNLWVISLLAGACKMMPAEGVSHRKTSAVRVRNLQYKLNDLTDSPERRTLNI